MDMDLVMSGRRVREFLADPAIKGVLDAYRQSAYRAFLAATTDDARRSAHAEAVVLDKFEGVLARIVEEGQVLEETAK